MKILLIEDDQIIANIYRTKFALEGFQVEVAFDGEVGLEMVKAFKPDCVVLDLMLPKLPGLELIRAVRAMPAFARTPIVVFSNTYLSNLVQDAWKAGATKCLSKTNCTPRHVIDSVRASLAMPQLNYVGVSAVPHGAKSPAPTPTPAKPSFEAEPEPVAPALSPDEQFQAELRQEFLSGFPAALTHLQAGLKNVLKADNDGDRVRLLAEQFQSVHTFAGSAAVAGMVHIAQLSDALEVLLKELAEKPKNLNPSTLRTVASTLDALMFLHNHGTHPSRQDLPAPQVMVVDDEVISRRAVTYALEKAKLKSVACADPQEALRQLDLKPFDLIILDVDMPGMSGFELCARVRTLDQYKKTPVIFVTSLNDFENRLNSSVSGGSDFIGKPFLFIELALKSLIHLQRSRLAPGGKT